MTLVSTLGQALDQIERIKQQQLLLGNLQLQVSTGKKTQEFTGLGSDTIISQRARADFKELDTYLNNIIRGETRVAQMLSSLNEIQRQAQNSLDALVGQPQQGNIDLSIIKQVATNAFDFVLDLLNTQDGDTYLFAGSDSSTKPISDIGSLDSFFSTLNPQWSDGTLPFTPPDSITDEYISQYRSIGDVTAGYSGSLNSAKDVFIRVNEGVELDYTIFANNPALRDIVIALGTIRNLPDVLNAPPPQGHVVGTADIQAASAGTSLITTPGNPYTPLTDDFVIRFDPGGPNDSGPIVIDLSVVDAANPVPPAASGAQALMDYFTNTVIPNLPVPLNTTTTATVNSVGEIVIGAEADIQILPGTMGDTGLAFMGLTAGTTSPTDLDSKDEFFEVFNDLARMLTGSIDAVDQMKFKINSVQVALNQTKERHTFDKSLLLNAISTVEDIDLSEVAVKLSFLQIQLEASFRITASVRDLSLVNFI